MAVAVAAAETRNAVNRKPMSQMGFFRRGRRVSLSPKRAAHAHARAKIRFETGPRGGMRFVRFVRINLRARTSYAHAATRTALVVGFRTSLNARSPRR